MRGMPHRGGTNKSGSARNFRHNVGKTHKFNMFPSPRRGGWRL